MRARKPLGEPLLERPGRLFGQMFGDDDLMRKLGCLVIVLGKELAHEVCLGHVEALVEDEIVADDDSAVSHDENMRRRNRLFAEESDNVDVKWTRKHGFLLLLQSLDGLEAITRTCGMLEIELDCRLLHLGLELSYELVALTSQKTLHAGNERRVLLGRDSRATGARSLANVVGEACLVIGRGPSARLDHARHLAILLAGHGANRHDAPHGIDGLAGRTRIGVGPKIARATLVLLARELDSRICGALGDGNEGVALVVTIVDVEGRIVLLDEVLLENERFGLVVHHDVVERCDLLHHERDLEPLVLTRHVLHHACTQIDCLADVQDLALGVLPKVASRSLGHALQLLAQVGRRAIVRAARHDVPRVRGQCPRCRI